LIFGRIKHLDKKSFCKIEEDLTIGESALSQIIAGKGDNITFLFEGHYSEILKA
jgi:hypothetical protein